MRNILTILISFLLYIPSCFWKWVLWFVCLSVAVSRSEPAHCQFQAAAKGGWPRADGLGDGTGPSPFARIACLDSRAQPPACTLPLWEQTNGTAGWNWLSEAPGEAHVATKLSHRSAAWAGELHEAANPRSAPQQAGGAHPRCDLRVGQPPPTAPYLQQDHGAQRETRPTEGEMGKKKKNGSTCYVLVCFNQIILSNLGLVRWNFLGTN